MAEETDGVREAFDDALRIALTVAMQLGEKVARLREQFARQREARAVQTNRELESRFDAERGAMRASLLPLRQASWWDQAGVADIANAREAAVAWRDYDELARETNDSIDREVRDRYGIDVSQPGADPTSVAAALRAAEGERAQAMADRERDGDVHAAADLLLIAADRRDREVAQATTNESAAGPDYDSASRRREFAASIAGVAAPETIAARILADEENARHPREAVVRGNAPSLAARGTRPAKARLRERGEGTGR